MSTIIINLGMDVHTTNYTLCCYKFYNDTFFAETSVAPDFREVLKYMDTVRKAQKETFAAYPPAPLGAVRYSTVLLTPFPLRREGGGNPLTGILGASGKGCSFFLMPSVLEQSTI